MNVEIEAEAPEYIKGIFVAVHLPSPRSADYFLRLSDNFGNFFRRLALP
jgi:hypothetical protein